MLHQEELRPKYVTQEEAAAVIDLWAKMNEARAGTDQLLTIGDVSEALNLSPAEVEILLARVRNAPAPLPTEMPRPTGPAFALLIVSIFACTVFTVGVMQASMRMSIADGDSLRAWLAAGWVLIWAWYFRRPVSRFVKRFFGGQA